MNIILFTYDTAHEKTNRICRALQKGGITPVCVVAAPLVKIDLKRSRHSFPAKPPLTRVWRSYEWPAMRAPHDSEAAVALCRGTPHALGLVAGARILPRRLIEACSIGILNLHPGLLPENRGLDAMVHALWRGVSQGVTAHLIDERVDAGRIVLRCRLPVKGGMLPEDVAGALRDLEVEIMGDALKLLAMGARGYASEPATDKNEASKEIDDYFTEHWHEYIHEQSRLPAAPLSLA